MILSVELKATGGPVVLGSV